MSRRAVLALLSSLVSLALCELAARAVIDQGGFGEALARIGPHGERVAAYASLRHKAATDPITPLTTHDPQLGTRALPGVHRRPHYTATVDPLLGRQAPAPHHPDAARVLVFGDSYTYGYDVGDHEVYTAQVQALRPDLELLNLAVPGYGHDQIYDRFVRDAAALEPDAVVLGALQLDLQRNVRSFYTYEKPWYTLDDGILTRHGAPVPDLPSWLRLRARSSRLIDLGWVLHEGLMPHHRDLTAQTELGAALIGAFVDAAQAADLPCLILIFPDGSKVGAAGDQPVPPFEAVARVCARPGVTCLDVGPAFRDASQAGTEVQGESHWNAAGHRVVAQAWAQWMAQTGWPL
jgi:hypothetical protein